LHVEPTLVQRGPLASFDAETGLHCGHRCHRVRFRLLRPRM